MSGKKVLIGLTGRLASCVAAFLLKKQGYDVIGISIVTNINENFVDRENYPKCHIDNLEAISDFCSSINIPFFATDIRSQFEYKVVDPFLGNKLAARANATCFNCTKLRIDTLYKKMEELNADFIATGHFCKIHKNISSNISFVHASNHIKDDQSFLLSGVDHKYLDRLILPLGDLCLDDVEKIAKKFNIKVASKHKKYDFCFRNTKSYKIYADKIVPKSLKKEGQILNVDNEFIYGDHSGILNHYISQKDFFINGSQSKDDKVEVVGYDPKTSVLKVGNKKHITYKGLQLVNLEMSSGLDKTRPLTCFFKTKHTKEFKKCELFFKNNYSAILQLAEPLYPTIIGEIIVLFDKDKSNAKVIGHGKIQYRGDFKLVNKAQDFAHKEDGIEPELPIFKF